MSTAFFDTSKQGRKTMSDSGYYHISDIIEIASSFYKQGLTDGNLSENPYSKEKLRERIIDDLMKQDWSDRM
ncbi:hypothetical protein ACQR3P_28990 [Rhodococcus sp. IEGM1300]